MVINNPKKGIDLNLTETQSKVLDTEGNILITGGPGSGKTTVSILKAAQIADKNLMPEQKVLFLSFARSTVSRVTEAILFEKTLSKDVKKKIQVETYHSFFWRVLKTHGYLIGLPRKLNILTPTNESVELSGLRSRAADQKFIKREEEAELKRLAFSEGKISFSLFAPFLIKLLTSSRVLGLISEAFPAIILDEFQDTNSEQWEIVKRLGKASCLITLADPEQRIFGWLGADPKRLNQFKTEFRPTTFDFQQTNHRSLGTEIALLGNDVLSGNFKNTSYNGVTFRRYDSRKEMTDLITTIYRRRKILRDENIPDWSLAVLVPTKSMTLKVSRVLNNPPAGMQSILHAATLDMEAALLSAEIVALLLQQKYDKSHFAVFIELLCNYYKGKGGDKPTIGALNTANDIKKSYEEYLYVKDRGGKVRSNSIIAKTLASYLDTRALVFTGDPAADWIKVRDTLENGTCQKLRDIAESAKDIRILGRGSELRQLLSDDWLNNGAYLNSLDLVRQAFIRDHFSTNSKPEKGIIVTNMHKAKGKQFDEVIIFEGWPRYHKKQLVANPHRIVQDNSSLKVNNDVRQNLRVSITRAKRHTTILSPGNDLCIILKSLFR